MQKKSINKKLMMQIHFSDLSLLCHPESWDFTGMTADISNV